MPRNSPAWWYPDENTAGATSKILPWLLSPATAVYSTVSGHRLSRAPKYVPSIPVICIGNFTAGGTGKTPLSIEIAKRLQKLGARPAFLTRGYGGDISGPYDVDIKRDTAQRTGDEPLLLARTAPTVIARNRVLGARHIEHSDASVIIMDDGMQNPALAKTLTLAVVDGSRGLGNGWSIPSGPLRANLSQQARRVDAIVINGRVPRQLPPMPDDFSGPVLSGELRPPTGSLDLGGRAVVAFSGIGNPARFHQTLDSCGADLRATIDYADHHTFSDADAENILAVAAREAAMIVTTEKDLVRLRSAAAQSLRAALLDKSYALPVNFSFSDCDGARLDALLDMLVRQNGMG